ncbi:MAG TPA: hypothetical protein VHB51_00340 [Candidatus Saccharimonadales bacterium]|nr:hypothetical protein [Candidatus Saccharimonadales bacterium]
MHGSWQDIVLSICILGFDLALIPTLLSKKHNPHAGTGVITAFFQMVAVVVYIDLRLWYTVAMGTLNAVMWSVIVVQSLRYQPKRKRRV